MLGAWNANDRVGSPEQHDRMDRGSPIAYYGGNLPVALRHKTFVALSAATQRTTEALFQ